MSLLNEELSGIKKTIPNAKIVANAVVRLFFASPDPGKIKSSPVLQRFTGLSNRTWTETGLDGGLVLTYEQSKLCFQIFHLDTFKRRFKFEIYEDMDYVKLTDNAYCFEIDDCLAGFLFSSKIAAENVNERVQMLRPLKQGEKRDKRPGFFRRMFTTKAAGDNSSTQTIDIGAIGPVMDVQQTAHLGINPDGSFQMSNIPAAWKELFKAAGVKPRDLRDKETALKIVSAIEADDMANTLLMFPEYKSANKMTLERSFNDTQREQYREYMEKQEAFERQQAKLAAWEQTESFKVKKNARGKAAPVKKMTKTNSKPTQKESNNKSTGVSSNAITKSPSKIMRKVSKASSKESSMSPNPAAPPRMHGRDKRHDRSMYSDPNVRNNSSLMPYPSEDRMTQVSGDGSQTGPPAFARKNTMMGLDENNMVVYRPMPPPLPPPDFIPLNNLMGNVNMNTNMNMTGPGLGPGLPPPFMMPPPPPFSPMNMAGLPPPANMQGAQSPGSSMPSESAAKLTASPIPEPMGKAPVPIAAANASATGATNGNPLFAEMFAKKLKKTEPIDARLPDASRFSAKRKNSIVGKLKDALKDRRKNFEDDDDDAWSDFEPASYDV